MITLLLILLLSIPAFSAEYDGYFLKLTDKQATQLIDNGISSVLSKDPSELTYTYYILDEATGDKYWCIEDVRDDKKMYLLKSFFKKNYGEYTRYTYEQVEKFLPEDHY